jgi:hypothetical protein
MKPVKSLRFSLRSCPWLLLLLVLRLTPAHAQIVYDNSSGGGTNVYYQVQEYGDEIVLGGTSRVVDEFQFEYYGDFVATGVEMARLRLYKNDGPPDSNGDPTPGTVLYDSGPFSILPGYQTKAFSGLNLTVPTDITWTVQFTGLVGGTGDEAGLIIRNPPTVGSSYDDFWMKTPSGWALYRWGGNPVANFAARVTAVAPVTPVSVAIQRASNNVVLQWSGTYVLQVATSAAGPYTDVNGAVNTYQFDTRTAPVQFWRLRQ